MNAVDEQVIDMIKSRRRLESLLRQTAIELGELSKEILALTEKFRRTVEQRDEIRAKLRTARGEANGH